VHLCASDPGGAADPSYQLRGSVTGPEPAR